MSLWIFWTKKLPEKFKKPSLNSLIFYRLIFLKEKAMAIKKELIKKKLAILKDYLRKIENMDFDQEDLVENRNIQDLLVFRLQQTKEVFEFLGKT